MKVSVAMLLALALSLPLGAARAQEEYYVNPDGGQFYHADRECPSISEQYRAGMVALSLAEVPEQYAPCPFCAPPARPLRHDTSWVSAYDTAGAGYLPGPYSYTGGKDVPAGVYTACMGPGGRVTVTLPDGATVHDVVLSRAVRYSFYLGEGMTVAMPEESALIPVENQGWVYEERPREGFFQERRMLRYEQPAGVYLFQSLDGSGGCVTVSSILAEQGLEEPMVIPIPAGETVRLDLRFEGWEDPYQAYFIEFENCTLWPAPEGGEG